MINLLGLSSGKDSTAALGWMLHESGYDPATLRFSFADTENEYQEVYDQIDRLDDIVQKHGCPPIARLRSIGFLNLCIKKKRFPSARARFCTEHLKMIPTMNYILAFVWLEGIPVISHSGVRADESTERSLLEEWGWNEGMQCKVRRPLLKWTLADVWAAHKKWKLPINALYFKGRRRVGCKLCCMSNKLDVRITAKENPEVIDLYRKWEKIVGSDKVKASNAQGHGSGFFRATTIPEMLHSVKGLVRNKNNANGKKGDVYSAATIDDVVKWSFTLRGGKQTGFDFMFEEDDSHVPCQMGYCE